MYRTIIHHRWYLLLLLFVGVFFRVCGSLGALWLDELWAIYWIHDLSTFTAIFTDYLSENNHFIQSIWLYGVDGFDVGIIKRSFSLVCSLLLLILVFYKARKDGGWRSIHCVFVSFSYFYILYGTEARGYSPLLLGLHLVYETGEVLVVRWSIGAVLLFWLATLFAAFSHLSALTFIAAVLLGFLPRIGLKRSTLVGVLPVLTVGLLWFFFVSRLGEASGDTGNEFFAITNLLSLGLGGPVVSVSGLGILSFLIALAAGVWLLKLLYFYIRDRKENWFFFLSGILLLPILTWVAYAPDFTYARHFLPALVVIYMFLSRVIADVFYRGEVAQKKIITLFLTLYLLGSGIHAFSLCWYGRGGYEQIVSIIAQDNGPIITDQAFRHQAMLVYFAERDGVKLYSFQEKTEQELPSWAILPPWKAESEPPKWFLSQGPLLRPPPEVDMSRYRLVQIFPSAPLSGWEVQLFRRR